MRRRSFGRPELAIHKASDSALAICLNPNEQPTMFGVQFIMRKWLAREVLHNSPAPFGGIDRIKTRRKKHT